MVDFKTFVIENWTVFLSFIFLYSAALLSLFIRQRVKNRANLRHILEIEKRKYKYESKREQFLKYFNLVDDFARKSNDDIRAKFLPLLNTYNDAFLSGHGNKERETTAITDFSEGIQTILFEANQDLLRIRGETNAIKILAGERTLTLIKDMDGLYDASFELSGSMVKKLITAVATNNFTEIHELEREAKEIGSNILRTKELMIAQIRIELDEI